MRITIIFFVSGVLFFFSACEPATQIDKSWTTVDSTASTSRLFNKILFVALVKDAVKRRTVEDRLVARSNGRGVASYSYLPAIDSRPDQSALSGKLKADGFDGIVVMRLAPADKSATYVPGNYPAYYGDWFGYYSNAAPGFSSVDYLKPGQNYYVETNVYSLESNKLIWTGVTSAVNLSDTDKMIDGIIKTVRDKMREQGLIK